MSNVSQPMSECLGARAQFALGNMLFDQDSHGLTCSSKFHDLIKKKFHFIVFSYARLMKHFSFLSWVQVSLEVN